MISGLKLYYIHVWVLGHGGYGVLGIAVVWVIDWVSPHTKLVIRKTYGVLGSMGYQSYGLGGSRLYSQGP